ncbi:hypothetical protein GH714_010617 [Hevea brasiliensis]|uniref:HAT C-terminal dimerisation domain-containing protein n=1 Tax=Hevea brasiliensis TaxID=3981 RepID=A0A6A6MU01_HEVBR|nr:hypothetical protein GH714_010617 [Hevea brasiliensis]
MVITAHFVDSNWRLQRRVINFVHLPPPPRGVEIAYAIFKCLKEWEIENKHGLKELKDIIDDVHNKPHKWNKILPDSEARQNVMKVKEALYEIYNEYVNQYNASNHEQIGEMTSSGVHGNEELTFHIGADEILQYEAHLKYHILSRLAADILTVPVTTVPSETTFSAGGRVIDPYRASLAPETVQILLCGGDWCLVLHVVKKKNKN